LKNFKNPKWREEVGNIASTIRERQIRFARLQFIDINGIPKGLSVRTKEIESIFENGQPFDGSSAISTRLTTSGSRATLALPLRGL
jgi:glutamine synthetase